jgi:hypothetical protein
MDRPSRLTPLQREILAEFFKQESRFYLTGGAALAGYHLGHRDTHDLDLFTPDKLLEEGGKRLSQVALILGASVEAIQTAPDFRRILLKRGDDGVIVDLVHDPTHQRVADKPAHGGVRVDPPEEILSNKLCALLSRAEIRDLVDVMALERAGYSVESALPAAARKDTGFSPAQLAWVLSQIKLGDDAEPPGGVGLGPLRDYLSELTSRLARFARPGK